MNSVTDEKNGTTKTRVACVQLNDPTSDFETETVEIEMRSEVEGVTLKRRRAFNLSPRLQWEGQLVLQGSFKKRNMKKFVSEMGLNEEDRTVVARKNRKNRTNVIKVKSEVMTEQLELTTIKADRDNNGIQTRLKTKSAEEHFISDESNCLAGKEEAQSEAVSGVWYSTAAPVQNVLVLRRKLVEGQQVKDAPLHNRDSELQDRKSKPLGSNQRYWTKKNYILSKLQHQNQSRVEVDYSEDLKSESKDLKAKCLEFMLKYWTSSDIIRISQELRELKLCNKYEAFVRLLPVTSRILDEFLHQQNIEVQAGNLDVYSVGLTDEKNRWLDYVRRQLNDSDILEIRNEFEQLIARQKYRALVRLIPFTGTFLKETFWDNNH